MTETPLGGPRSGGGSGNSLRTVQAVVLLFAALLLMMMAEWAWRIERSINRSELLDEDLSFAHRLRANLPSDSHYVKLWQSEDPCLWAGIKCAGPSIVSWLENVCLYHAC